MLIVYLIEANRANQSIRVTGRHSGTLTVSFIATVSVEGYPSKRNAILAIQFKIGKNRTTTLSCQTQAKIAGASVGLPFVNRNLNRNR